MDAKAYSAGLVELRTVRDEIKKARAALTKLTADRDRRVKALAGHGKANADRIAPAAGLSVSEVAVLAPSLRHSAPAPASDSASAGATGDRPAPQTAAQAITEPAGAPAPDLRRPTTPTVSTDPAPEAGNTGVTCDAATGSEIADGDREESAVAVAVDPVAGTADVAPGETAAATTGSVTPDGEQEQSVAELSGEPAVDGADQEQSADVSVPVAPALVAAVPTAPARELPLIPAGEAGEQWAAVTPTLVSKRPNFTQTPRQMAFLDTATGVLVHRDTTVRVELGGASAAEILTAVYAVVPDSVERVYVTAGDPWHRDADRYPYLRDAVAAWLHAPVPGWSVESSRGKDRMAGHLVHERNPVGRWQRGDQHTEIRSVGEWFDTGEASPAVVRDAFVLLWKALHRHWPDVVLMGSPSQTGRDLWSRTIPTRGRWAEGFPVMSQEIRGLLHATAGQGRTELIVPPRVPAKIDRLVEIDRTFAYAKHTWASGVGAPQRITAAGFAAMPEKDQVNALFAPSHWQVRVTVPEGWEHDGLLPAPAPGDRAWCYPAQPGRTFTTWAGGAEVNLALRNPIAPWRVEILDGLLWESGTPLKDWSTKLKEAWAALAARAETDGDPEQRLAAHLASRAVRSILLYGIGGFAQRPRMTTASTPVGREADIPPGAQIIGMDGQNITWQRSAGFSRDPYAHPEWAAGVWSGARAALQDMRMPDGTRVGALYLPPRTVVAYRTDSIMATVDPGWPYNGLPGEYRVKGHFHNPNPLDAPRTEAELMAYRDLGRAQLTEELETGR